MGSSAEDLRVSPPLKVLLVCGRNLRRSPTAEMLFRKDPRVSVRSAGVIDLGNVVDDSIVGASAAAWIH
jgi:protein-tyrosine-phosphatase